MPLTAQMVEGFTNAILANQFDQPKPTPDFHRELWELCTSNHPLVAIGAPRGHAKSTAITHAYTLAALLFREHQFVLLVSDTEGQAVGFLGDIKKELQTNEALISLFGVKGFVKDSEADIIVEMEDGYLFRVIAKGSEQKVRGIKWANKRPDLIICDDLENDEIVMNQDRRDKFKRWFRGALMPCRGPKGKIRLVGTVLHQGSLLNDLLPSGKLSVDTGIKVASLNPKAAWKAVKYKAHNSDFSQILWKEMFPKDKLQSIRQEAVEAGYPDLYSQEYLNNPIDESVSYFRKGDFIAMTEDEKRLINQYRNTGSGDVPLLFYAGADLAISQKERADWTVIQVVGVADNNTMFHADTIRARMDSREIVETILQLQTKWKLQWLAIEKDRISQAIGPFLKEEMVRRGIFVNLIEMTPSQDKPTRARSIQARMRAGTVKFDKDADYYPKLEEEFIRFPRDMHDDQVDALSAIGLALDKVLQANSIKEQELEEWEDFDLTYNFPGMFAGRSATTGY